MARLVRPPKPAPTPTTGVLATLREDINQPTVPDQSVASSSNLNFDAMTVAQLRTHLRDLSIRFPSRAKKGELIRLALQHRRETSEIKFEDLAGIVAQESEALIAGLQKLQTAADPPTMDQTTLEEKRSQPTNISRSSPAAVDPDLTGLTVVQLRQYLRGYSIRIPSRARRAQLLQIATEHQARTSDSDIEASDLTIISEQLSKLSIEESQVSADPTTGNTSNEATSNEPKPIISNEIDINKPLANIPIPTDDISYLQPGFKPASLTVPKLRNVLTAHEVMCTKARKKEDFVKLFEDFIAPRANATLQAMATVEKTTEGIVDA
ncbi:sister chromatid separation protein [Colletotrichum camelliae]|nr:sister chromatid separation protein [Colletotrichum camelliae]